LKVKLQLALAVLVSVMVIIGSAPAQQPAKTANQQIAGTWTLVSITLEQDGKKTDFLGPNPKGVTILDGNGHFARVLTRSDLPKFASNNRAAGAPEENKAIVQGSIAYFGTYSLDPTGKTISVHIEASTFPNWVGAEQQRLFTVVGDELRETNPAPSTGTGKVEVVWKRVS
jgi:hypothetical protein